MSAHNLKPGDRVRVTVQDCMRGYQPGDQGTVLRERVVGPATRATIWCGWTKTPPRQTASSSRLMRSNPTCDLWPRRRSRLSAWAEPASVAALCSKTRQMRANA
jgi:hypothetical protein